MEGRHGGSALYRDRWTDRCRKNQPCQTPVGRADGPPDLRKDRRQSFLKRVLSEPQAVCLPDTGFLFAVSLPTARGTLSDGHLLEQHGQRLLLSQGSDLRLGHARGERACAV